MPIVSGNVSFYNESAKGAVDPSAIIACLGRLADCRKAITMEFKEAGSIAMLIGRRKNELGGSVYYQLQNELGANVPRLDFKEAENQIYAVTDLIDEGLLLACHDISDGGLAIALAEMSFGGNGQNRIGADIDLTKVGETNLSVKLFSETGGFVLETKRAEEVKKACAKYGVEVMELGRTREKELQIKDNGREIVNLTVEAMSVKWLNGLRDKMDS